jgi:cardiolipin synthase
MSKPRLEADAWYESLKPVERSGHDVALLESGREFFPALERAIDAARSQVFVETYIFEDDAAGGRIAEAMARAVRRGVEVRLVVDGYGTPRLRGAAAAVLREGGVAVEVFRPARGAIDVDRQRLRRLHRKLAVVDGAVAFVGGINILDDLRDPNHGPLAEPRLDFAVRVRGPLVATAHLAMARLWRELSIVNRPLRALRPGRAAAAKALVEPVVSDVADAGPMRAMLLLRDNFRFRRTIERAYLSAIGAARREVLIANAYFFPGARMRRALVHAARRGVRVRLLLQGRVEYRLAHWASQALYDELLRAGVEIVEYRRSFLHAKVAVIDDWATVGSSNIDPFSLLLAREANVVVRDSRFAAELRARLQRAIDEGGEPVLPTRHAARPLPMRLLELVGFAALRLGVAISGQGRGY